MKRRKPLALLAYLSVRGQRQSRDALAELLYPGQDREHALSDLRQCLFLLRGSIGDERLEVDADGVALAESETWLDVRELRRLLEEVRGAEKAGDATRRLDRLDACAGLFRGDFLSGFFLKDCPGFDDWQQAEEQGLRQQRARILERLVSLHEERGALGQAVEHCRAWLLLDPAKESVHRKLMLLHAMAGERAAALKQYERCREALRRELDRAPDAETEKLRERIVSGKAVAPRAAPQPSPAGKAPVHGAGAPSPPPLTRPAILLTDPPSTFAGSYDRAEAALIAAVENRSPGIRMAIHAGASERAEHLLDLANPGQVLVSAAAARLLGDELPRGASVRSIGLHRMKDLGPALEIYQLLHPTLQADFPPIRSLDSRPNNLPSQPTAFLGRLEEQDRVVAALRREDIRLLTLTGPGGSGKTRLALQAAAALVDGFQHGAFFVDLAPVSDPGQVPSAVLASLGVRDASGNRSAFDALRDYLKGRELLLVLDNLEHLMTFADSVAGLVNACARLKVLATSREPLRLTGEREMPVSPFRTVGLDNRIPLEELARQDAVRLFVERAQAVKPDFILTPATAPAVTEICERLDGLPLAIEINAALLRYLSLESLREKLRGRLALPQRPARDTPARHRTLEATIAWSYDLLDGSARAVFRRFSVFAGGCTLDAARAVCSPAGDPAADVLSLVDKSLIISRDSTEPRFQMLQTIREYAREKLEESGEVESVEEARAAYFLGVAERAEPAMLGREEETWRQRLAGESENIRSSLIWFRDHDVEKGLRLAAALGHYWQASGDLRSGRDWLGHFRNLRRGGAQHLQLAKVCLSLGWIRFLTGSTPAAGPDAHECWAESLEHARAAGDKSLMARAQVVLAWSLTARPVEAAAAQREAIRWARESGDRAALADCLVITNVSSEYSGEDLATRGAGMEEALAIAQEVDNASMLLTATVAMGRLVARTYDPGHPPQAQDLSNAEPWFRKALEIAESRRIRGYNLSMAYSDLGGLYADMGQLDRAEPLLLRCLSITAEEGWMSAHVAYPLADLSRIARARGDQRRAVRLMAAAHSFHDPKIGPVAEVMQRIEPLDPKILEEEWPIGHAMTRDQAVAYALSGTAE